MLKLIQDQLSYISTFWELIVIIEFIIIVYLFVKYKKTTLKDGFEDIRKAKSNDIDMGGLMDSINGAKNLFKELSKKYHPDKFTNQEQKIKAENIYQEITNSKHNFAELKELQKRAEIELD